MKICTKCLNKKPGSEFFVRDKKTGRLHAQCKECYRLQRTISYAEHYKKYRKLYLLRAKNRRNMLREEYRTKMIAYLSDKACEQCGEGDIRTLEFDHLDPSQKKFSISQGVRLGYSWDEIILEINECRILCANCHKKHTSSQFGWYKDI